MKHPRVQISGFGFITPIGNELSAFNQNILAQSSAIKKHDIKISGHQTFSVPLATCNFDEKTYISPSKLPCDRATAMALYSLEKALSSAQIDLQSIEKDRIGIFWGSGMAGASSFDQTSNLIYSLHSRIRPTSVVTGMPNAPAAELALRTQAQGSCITYACACASSSIAIGEGMRAIRGGWIDLAIVGGSESMLTPGMLMAWNALRVMAPIREGEISSVIPFSKDRSGFAMGEGAAAFILQKENDSKAKKYFLSGYATNSDGQHMTNPQSATQIKVMQSCLKDADLSIKDIGYINAHGTATVAGDTAEARSIDSVFKNEAVLVSSTKYLHGHLLGASGAVELIACISALEQQCLPSNSNKLITDHEIALNLVNDKNQNVQNLEHVLSNSFAFGGTNASLIVSK